LVILTSNRTRELSDALKRRCLYHWLDYPDPDKEIEIIKKNLPEAEESLVRQVVSLVQKLRTMKLQKIPGIAESIDWASTLMALNYSKLDESAVNNTLGAVLKSNDDISYVKGGKLKEIIQSF